MATKPKPVAKSANPRRAAAGRKGGRSRSPAKIAAAAANGAEGGRPRSQLPAEAIADLGPPPVGDVRKLRDWNAKLIATVMWLQIRGEVSTDLAASLRASAGALERVLPPPPPPEDPDDREGGAGHDDPDEPTGPELEPAAAAGRFVHAPAR